MHNSGLEVLIVDDDDVVIFLHKKIISNIAFHPGPLTFNNGKQTLDYLMKQEHPNKTYLVLLDINMPEMTGWDFLDAIQVHPVSEQMLTVLVTSSIDQSDRDRALGYSKVIGYIEKPITAEKLIRLKEESALSSFFS